MNEQLLKNIVEAAVLAADTPITIKKLLALFDEMEQVDQENLEAALVALAEDYEDRGIELKLVSTGYRIQVRQDLSQWIAKIHEEKPHKYSKAFLETLSLIAYRQPITRAGVEEVRGVSVSSNIMKSLLEREWVRVVGHRDVPGKPALYGTTKVFLDYFSLESLSDLPPLAEMRSIDTIQEEFDLKLTEGLQQGEMVVASDDSTDGGEAESDDALTAHAVVSDEKHSEDDLAEHVGDADIEVLGMNADDVEDSGEDGMSDDVVDVDMNHVDQESVADTDEIIDQDVVEADVLAGGDPEPVTELESEKQSESAV